MQLSLLRAIKAHTIFLLSFVLLFTTGCEDDDHDNHDHGHTDADGFILESNGTEIYREFEGSVTGSVTLNVGDTLELAVHFLDHEGEEIEHDEEEGEEHEEGELEVFKPFRLFSLKSFDVYLIKCWEPERISSSRDLESLRGREVEPVGEKL